MHSLAPTRLALWVTFGAASRRSQRLGLKAKRMVLRSVKDRIRKNFNVSIAEVEDNDQWQSAGLAIAIVSNDRRFANQVLSKIVDFIGKSPEAVIDDYRLGFL